MYCENIDWHEVCARNLDGLNFFDHLYFIGCLYHAKGEVLRVYKGALIVIKRKLKNRLYILQGTMVVGTTIVSSLSHLDQTCL